MNIRAIIIGLLLPCALFAQDQGWFAFTTHGKIQPSVIGVEDWLDKPAGKHGFLQSKGNQYVFEDGTPIKFWGVNITGERVFADKDAAEQWSSHLAKYGVNAVRLHKFTKPGYIGTGKSTNIAPDKYDKLDYFSQCLREKGIYYGWSPIFGQLPQPDDRQHLIAFDEIVQGKQIHENSTMGILHFSEDLQDLSIKLVVNLLNHRNPYTGLRYADDPALTYIEMQNEDDVFFARSFARDAKYWNVRLTYKAIACKKFSEWLRKKYGSHQALVAAWGEKAIDAFPTYQTDEHLDKNNIFPMTGAWYFNNERTRKRLLDTARFLFDLQNEFYQRFAQAIRKTGYKGELIGSCWLGGDDIAHFYNLYSDYLIGAIDRHSYSGGIEGKDGSIVQGKIQAASMLETPGTGLMTVPWWAVTDRPFAISEWSAKSPNEWISEAPPIIAAYGMGLQGWGASYAFCSKNSNLQNSLQSNDESAFNTDAPCHIGLYPAISRMIYSNELKEGKPVAIHKVSIKSLEEGKLDWNRYMDISQNSSNLEEAVSRFAVAIGKVGVEFTPEYEKTIIPDLTPYIDQTRKVIHSTTGQMSWYFGDHKCFTVQTPSAKMWVGFMENQKLTAGNISLECKNPFAVVTVSSLEKGVSIDKSKSLLITTIGRSRNTGMEYSADGKSLIARGTAPLQMEGVEATITFPVELKGRLYILNHDGERTEKFIELSGKQIKLSGALHQTLYYEMAL